MMQLPMSMFFGRSKARYLFVVEHNLAKNLTQQLGRLNIKRPSSVMPDQLKYLVINKNLMNFRLNALYTIDKRKSISLQLGVKTS
jgi:hypothetical protein